MAIRRNDSRRRRVVLDEAVQSGGREVGSPRSSATVSANSKNRVYSEAAKRDGQLKTTDLIPKRLLTIAIVVLAVVTAGILVNFLAWKSSGWNDYLSPNAIQALSLSGVGSISTWFSSFLLMLSGMASLQIYAMRRHRRDDYNGAYRIWLWMALLLALASVNCVVDLRSIFESLGQLAGFSGSNSLMLVLLAKFAALTTVIVRGVVELRASRAALVAVILVWVAYSSAIVTQLPVLQERLVENFDVVYGNSILIGTLATFFATMTYARYVYLQANELIRLEQSNKKSKAKTMATGKKVTEKPVISDTTRQASPRRQKAAADSSQAKREMAKSRAVAEAQPNKSDSTKTVSTEQQEILSLSAEKNLSKSERRRLKKLQKRQRRAA